MPKKVTVRLGEEGMSLAGRWKKGLFSLLFSRIFLIFILIILQVLITLVVWNVFGEFLQKYVRGGQILLASVVMIYLINSPMDSSGKIAWLLVIAVAPLFGSLFYIWTQSELGHRTVGKRIGAMVTEGKNHLPQNEEVLERMKKADPESASLANYLYGSGPYPVWQDTEVGYFPLGDDKFPVMLRELEKAEKFIFLEYFIIEEGYMWGKILEVLAKKAAQGVEVRVLYDGTCELSKVPADYAERLEALGIRCRVWAALYPVVTSTYNYRDHRKILVIDGKVAFNGGVNLADEYINRTSRFGHWKDTALVLRGRAVRSFTEMFLEMWNVRDRQPEDFSPYLEIEPEVPENARGFVLPYADEPLDRYKAGEMAYIDILNTAESYVYITTPYLILDGELETALKFAAERGVDVRLMMPGIPDKKLINILSKSYYRNLMESGVRIYEYTPGFVHAKMFLSDDRKAVVGTINLDYRSLYHHFECATFLLDAGCIPAIREDLQRTFACCEEVSLDGVRRRRPAVKLAGAVLKMIAPML